ncbi:uncharacterized protein AMSG_01635 [Thecamonas trahens ATCC 50062]|uniref:DNA repair protein SWI5 homolog n=1 Tax=Thecamonas trahens ATCC 50062 TaxID=461836 RepID=A0A0L0DTJ2_THETB|nr:hypothetical protein AMSG_01635 [Thecamonas trahens ATCC 50062]KNC54783.1 hypothetical protein AMSG_01635 [Thecamonas trahens ATCC 50062]|eukprot:XP_013761683.1 hypothetical protein AMSG_01635 [Thecamonas trahens ATCC 50062]
MAAPHDECVCEALDALIKVGIGGHEQGAPVPWAVAWEALCASKSGEGGDDGAASAACLKKVVEHDEGGVHGPGSGARVRQLGGMSFVCAHYTGVAAAALENELAKVLQTLDEVRPGVARGRTAAELDAEYDAYIEALHQYNEMRDVAVELLGKLAVMEGVRVTELYERYELDVTD